MTGAARIVLIHAVTVAIAPVEEAFRAVWPEAVRTNLLDDSLSRDRAADAELTDAIRGRVRALAEYAALSGASGILFTCSAFGEAIEEARAAASIPILKPNEAMFDRVLEAGTRIGMLATFEPSVASMEQEFRSMAARRDSRAQLETICVAAAMQALQAGDAAKHDRLVAESAARFRDHDAVMLAHFSTARAAAAVEAAIGPKVHTSPSSAVQALKTRIYGGRFADRRTA